MLKTVIFSSAKKTGGCAVTYRAGAGDQYGTCPNTCNLKPAGKRGADSIDLDYLRELIRAVPAKGQAFTYTHFNPAGWKSELIEGGTVINFSADNPEHAAKIRGAHAVPVVTVVNRKFWQNAKSREIDGQMIVRCPAERNKKITCRSCAGGRPLCAKSNRSFIVGFTAHGTGAKLAEVSEQAGGCYASHGHCNIHWKQTSTGPSTSADGIQLRAFVKGLPPGSILRHHVAGDIGQNL